jgi:cytochrome b
MNRRRILVWDAPTRLFHWSAVVLVAACYVTERLNWMQWHAWAGEALLALVLFRIFWGVFGSETARFSHFLASPIHGLRHLARLHHREPDSQIGHNAAGGWMVLVMILLLLAQCLTGLYVNNDIADEGPFTEIMPAPIADLIERLHAILWNALLAMIALHLLAILAYAFVKRHNLVLPMLTGRKHLHPDTSHPRIVSAIRALLLLTIGAILVILIASFA